MQCIIFYDIMKVCQTRPRRLNCPNHLFSLTHICTQSSLKPRVLSGAAHLVHKRAKTPAFRVGHAFSLLID